MADNWWENDPIVGQQPSGARTGYIPGVPKAPQPPSGYTGDSGGLHYIPGGPADPSAPGNNQANQRLDNINGMRKQFEGEQPVQDYKTVIPLMDNAFKLGPNKAGDLNLVYAFGKIMDPGSVVREGEQVMASNVGGVSEKVKGYIDQINGGAGLTTAQRTELTEEIRNRARSLAQTYNQRRTFYEDFAKRNGINPLDVVGPHPASPFVEDEKGYIKAHGGIPKINGVPIDGNAPEKTVAGFDGELPRVDPQRPHAEDYRNGLYNALRSGRIKSGADLKSWEANFNQQNGTDFNANLSNKQTISAIRAARSGGAFNVDLPKYNPDISDVRGGNNTAGQDSINATARGILDTPTLGVIDKLVAGADTIARPDTSFGENLARQYAISDFDQANHPGFRIAGQALGGGLLPMGEMSSIGQIMAKSAALGGGYGLGSSRSLSDIPGNVITGAASGAAVGGVLGGAGKGLAALRGTTEGIPPLVDPVTGELNQPMDAMLPADRVKAMQDYGMKTITPGMAGGRSARIGEQVLNNLPASAGHMEDVNSVASKELRRSMQGVAQQFGSSSTMNEGGTQLQQGTKQWMTRFDAVTGKAYDAIPISGKAAASTTNTTATLEHLGSRLADNPELAAEVGDPVLQRYLGAIERGGLTWQGMKEFRTFIGNKIGQFRFSEDARTGDYRALYGALSQDMRDTAASMGPRALNAFERANTIKAQGEQRIESALTAILGPDAKARPELAAAAIQRMTQGGKAGGDLRALAQIRASTIKSGAWDEIASTLIHLGGQPAKSEGRAFQPTTFVNWYSDMSEAARNLLFKPELRKSLDGFVAMNQQLSRVRALNNTSNTGALLLAGGQLLQFGKMLMSGDLVGMGIQVGANGLNYGLAKAWTTPTFVKLVTGMGRAAASGNEGAVRSQMGRLAKLATTNPELRQPIEKLLRSANDNLGTVGRAAAGADPNGDQQQ